MPHRHAVLLSLALAAGCSTWAAPNAVTFRIDAPATVRRGEHLVFHVETLGQDGQAVRGLKYQYLVDWVGVSGMVHGAVSFEPEKITAKGDPGSAKLRVYARGDGKARVQVAEREFRVE